MIEIDINSIIFSYLQKSKALLRKGGAKKDGELYQEIIHLEKQLLRSFGLPRTNKYCSYLWIEAESNQTIEKSADSLFKKLSSEAKKYLNSHPRTFNQLLTEAKLNKTDPFEVLPEMLVGTNSYTLFVYNEILLKNIDSEDNILKEYLIIREKDCLTDIYMLTQTEKWEKSELFKRLFNYGLKYLPTYMQWFEERHPTIQKNKKSNNVSKTALQIKVDEVYFMLNFAYKQYLKMKKIGFNEDKAKSLSGLTDKKTFFFAETLYFYSEE